MSIQPLRGVHVLAIIVGFFAVVIAVNVVFITRAVTSFPGEEATDSYAQGVAFNQTLAHRKAQAALGWTAEAGLEGDRQHRLVVRLQGPAGALTGLHVDATYVVIGRSPEAHPLSLREVKPGEYQVEIPAAGPGRLRVNLTAHAGPAGASPTFEAEKTLVLS